MGLDRYATDKENYATLALAFADMESLLENLTINQQPDKGLNHEPK